MAAITTGGSGNWSSTTPNAPWPGGTLPTSADDVDIASGHTLTLDTTSAVCNTLDVKNGGTFAVDPTVASKVVIEQGINTSSANDRGTFSFDMSGYPNNTCEIRYNNANLNNGTGYPFNVYGQFTFKGASKAHVTYTSGALTGQSSTGVVVEDITGWRVGDILMFSQTSAYTSLQNATVSPPSALAISNVSWSGGYLTITVADASSLYKGMEIHLYNLQTNLNGIWTIYDVPSGTTFRIAMADPTVTDTSGQAVVGPLVDTVTIASITPGTGTTGTITWSDGTGASGSVAHDHAAGCVVGNFTRNLIIGPATAHNDGIFDVASQVTLSNARLDYVMFDQLCIRAGYPSTTLDWNGSGTWDSMSFNAFYETGFRNAGGACVWSTNSANCRPTREGNLFGVKAYASYVTCIQGSNQSYDIGPEVAPVIIKAAIGINGSWPEASITNPLISGCNYYAGGGIVPSASREGDDYVTGGAIWACRSGVYSGQGQYAGTPIFNGTRFGCGPDATHAFQAANLQDILLYGNYNVELVGCPENTGGLKIANVASEHQRVRVFNKDGDTDVQESYSKMLAYTSPSVSRDKTTTNRSEAALNFYWDYIYGHERVERFKILTKSGVPVTIMGYMRRNTLYGTSALPYIEVSGLGITPVRITLDSGTAADTWEHFGFLPGTATEVVQNSGADGLLTVTMRGYSAAAGGRCFFAGIPYAPFITRCRHFGFIFDETLPTRTLDATVTISGVDPTAPTLAELESSETTANAIGGVTITWAASSTIDALTANKTFQQLWDYVHAQACQNVTSEVPLTAAGLAGAPALFAQGNITLGGTYNLSGSGSLSMGANTLSSSLTAGGAYTYTGGTVSGSTAAPTLAGGTLNIGAAGTYDFDTTDGIIVSMTPTAPGTYNLAAVTATGQLDLRNTSGSHAITVELAAGISYTTANNTGATITVSTPSIYQSVTLTGVTSGSRVQLYDTTAAAEVANEIVSTDPWTWTDSVAAAADRTIRLRVAYVSGTSAKEFIEANIGTCGQTEGTKAISYVVAQTNDTVYNTNAIDGSGVTGVTFTDAATDLVNIDVAGGTISIKSIYAAFVYWLFTASGIADDIAYIDAKDTANYVLTSMKIKNTSSPSVATSITGGYFRDVTTELVGTCIDTTGGTLFPQPDHVVAYATGSGSLTAGDITNIWSNASRTLTGAVSVTGTVDANITQVLGETVTGAGTEADPWGP